uniref:Piwi domain-containing protein n=1 Tax=Cuerna arida TaxID=1464854 RepID=A0A1B6EZT3_9HEMI
MIVHSSLTLPKKLFRPAIREMQRKYFPNRHPAFDGRKNLYSSGELPFGTQIRDTVSVSDPERNQPKEFDVTIKFANHVDMSLVSQYFSQRIDFPQEACQVLDIVLRNPAAMSFTPVGRSFFTPPRNQIISLGNGLELWYGFYQSSNLGWRPFLNVDVAHKGFPEPKPLLDVMLDMMKKHKSFRDPDPDYNMLRNAGISGLALEDFKKFIRGLKVDYMIPNQPNTRKVYKMNDIRASAIQHRFQLDDGRHITVGEYFERIKNYRLQFPKLPCIHVGSTSRDICLPPELCTVVRGQVVNKKLDETQTAAMVKAAARPADERKRRILQHMMEAGFNRDPCVNEFGISVNDKFEKIKARVLEAPNLEYRERKVKASQGVWRAAQFVSSNQLNTWVVMSLAQRTNQNDLVNFAKTMSSQGRNLGMSISEPCKYVLLHEEARLGRFPTGQVIKQSILPYFKEFKENGVQLVVVVIPDRPPDCYSRVKLAAEVDVGLLTQCIKERTFGRMNPATAGNILLKVNAKLNGVNHTIDRSFCPHLMDSPTMLVGADVTHPSPDQTTIPSVAAVAASHDRRAFQYNMIWKLQPPRMEIIEKLQEIMVDQLKFFYRFTKQKPNKIIFYRDGVSDGHFSQVLDSELSAIRAACRSLQADGSYKPSVTFLVVQKRHHTRFFPTRKEDEDGRNKNVPPGTIVDTVITHPREMDFYLVSHASLQGTSRPTKYHKLWDDSEISEDDLEELTYYLCHLFSRCTRSVSYPAPTYYAHLAAARGRVYLEGQQVNLTNLEQEMRIRTIKDSIKLQSPMFFV